MRRKEAIIGLMLTISMENAEREKVVKRIVGANSTKL
jgi:hypothetical protein